MSAEAEPSQAPDGPSVVEVKNITRILPGPPPVTLVEDVSLDLARGDFAAVTGPSGSGKSSLLYLMGLLDRPDRGEVLLQGQPTSAYSDSERARLRLSVIGYVFQFHFLLPEFTVTQNVMLPMRRLGKLSEADMAERADNLMEKLGIAGCRAKRPAQLSGGESQRAAIARALANDPAIILADEPTGNLDTQNSEIVFQTFAQLAADGDRAVVAVTHDPDMAAFCSRRIRLVDGRISSMT
jgi:lipoprotein-releasing system ATP-binding protein